MGGAAFLPLPFFGGAALVGVAFPFLFGVVLFSFLGWCCRLFVPSGGVPLSPSTFWVLLVLSFLFLVGGAAFPSSFLVVLHQSLHFLAVVRPFWN